MCVAELLARLILAHMPSDAATVRPVFEIESAARQGSQKRELRREGSRT
jgi:hypothetical protein